MGLFDFIFGDKKVDNEPKPQENKVFSFTIGGKTYSADINVLAKTKPMFDTAIFLYDSKQYSEAAKLFSQMIELQPDNSNYYVWRGTTYEDMGLDTKAKPDFEKAIKLEPTDSLALYRLGMLYTRNNNLEKAVEYLQSSFNNSYYLDNPMGKGFDNNLLFIHKKKIGNNLGFYLTQLGKKEDAYRILDDVIKNCPDYSYAYYTKGLSLYMEQKYIECILPLQKAQELGHPQAADLLSMVLMQSNVMGDSKKTYMEDRYSKMVRDTSFNPFNISLRPEDNDNILFSDLTTVFKQELDNIFGNLQEELNQNIFIQLLTSYAFSMIESYFNNAGMVPKRIMDEILRQIYSACSMTNQSRCLRQFSLDDFKYHLYYGLTHK